MAQKYLFPRGALVDVNGAPTMQGKAFLTAIEKWSLAISDVENLDSGTTYTANELRDKIIELIAIFQG
jgi:hypothetical protein